MVATRDNGSEQQIEHGATGLFVPHENPPAVARAMLELLNEPGLRRRLGDGLRRKVEREYAADIVVRRWEALIDEVIAEAGGPETRGREPGLTAEG